MRDEREDKYQNVSHANASQQAIDSKTQAFTLNNRSWNSCTLCFTRISMPSRAPKNASRNYVCNATKLAKQLLSVMLNTLRPLRSPRPHLCIQQKQYSYKLRATEKTKCKPFPSLFHCTDHGQQHKTEPLIHRLPHVCTIAIHLSLPLHRHNP